MCWRFRVACEFFLIYIWPKLALRAFFLPVWHAFVIRSREGHMLTLLWLYIGEASLAFIFGVLIGMFQFTELGEC